MRPLAAYLRSLNPDLPRVVWVMQAGGLANAFGNGVVLPFLIIYLHNARGLSLGMAGLVVAANAAAGLVSGPFAGALADRVGPRRVLFTALVLQGASVATFPLIRETWHAFALNLLMGTASGAFWPSQSSLLTALTPHDRRPAAFAQQRVTMNLGIALGSLVGGLIAGTSGAGGFTTLFLVDAVTFLAFAAVLLRIPSPPRAAAHAELRGTYADVMRDRAFVRFTLLNAVLITAAIAPLVELFPPFAKNEAGVSERAIGVLFFLNTLVIVVAQLPVAKLQEGKRRMPAMAITGLLWAVAWLVVLAGGAWLGGTNAALAFAAGLVLFSAGQCLHGAVQGPLVAGLAPPALVGRYMALLSLTWQLGFVVGPAGGGFLLQHEPLALWAVAAAICVGAAAYALALERRLPHEVLRTPVRTQPALAEG